MLEKTSDKRISLNEICFHKWFFSNYHSMHSNKHIDIAESSTKGENGSKTQSVSDCNSPPPKLQRKKAKLSCFVHKISDADNYFDINNEGDISKNYYDIQPKFLESTKMEGSSLMNALHLNKKKMKNIMECSIVDQMKGISLYLGVNFEKSISLYIV